jgi:hypothetical protein
VTHHDSRTVLTVEDLSEPGDVVRQRTLRKLRRGHRVSVGLEILNDGTPAGPIGPSTMHKNDIWMVTHVLSFLIDGG